MHEIARGSIGRQPQAQVMVVSPRQLYLDAFQRLIKSSMFTIVGGGRTLEEALQTSRPDIDIALIIYNFASDAEVEQEIPRLHAARARFPQTKSIILADRTHVDTKLKAMQAGVEGFLSKDISLEVLQCAIELVLLGEHIVPAALARMLLDRGSSLQAAEILHSPPGDKPVALPARSTTFLSSREHQILRCLVDGLTNKAIARELDITEATVKVHVKALLRKTRMANRTQAAIWGLNYAVDGDLAQPDNGADRTASQRWLRGAQQVVRATAPATVPHSLIAEADDATARRGFRDASTAGGRFGVGQPVGCTEDLVAEKAP